MPCRNLELYACHGYVTLIVNFHGSSSFGHKYCLSISKDWGGAPYHDIMATVDHVLATRPYVDGNRMAALGGSYGGYMVNWINGAMTLIFLISAMIFKQATLTVSRLSCAMLACSTRQARLFIHDFYLPIVLLLVTTAMRRRRSCSSLNLSSMARLGTPPSPTSPRTTL